MERIALISVVLLASLIFNLLAYLLPLTGRRMVEVVNAEARLVEVAPGYEGWYQPSGETIRDASSPVRFHGAARLQDDEDGSREAGSPDDGDWDRDDND